RVPFHTMTSPFTQPAPILGNQYESDRVLRSYLRRVLPKDMLAAIEPELSAMGELAGTELFEQQRAERLREPVLTQWSPWGERIDEIEISPLWRKAEKVSTDYGLIATAYEQKYGRWSRVYQMALVYLFHPSSDFYTCPLAMTDGAARTLLEAANQE